MTVIIYRWKRHVKMSLRQFILLSAMMFYVGVSEPKPLHVWKLRAPPTDVLPVINHLIILGNSTLFLKMDFSEGTTVQLEGMSNLSVIPGSKYLMLLFKNGSYGLGSIDDTLSIVDMSENLIPHTVDENLVIIHTMSEPNSVYVGATKPLSRMSGFAKLVMLKVNNYTNSFKPKPISCVVQLLLITSEYFVKRDYLHTFHHNEHAYFIVKDTFIDPLREVIKIFRRRKENDINGCSNHPNYELELQSKPTTASITEVVYLKFGEILILGLVGGNKITFLSYSINELDHKLDKIMKKCSDGNYVFDTQWSQKLISCSELEKKGRAGTIVADSTLTATNHLVLNASSIFAVAVAPASHAHFSVYLVTTRSRRQIKQFSIPTNLNEAIFMETISVPDAVLHMRLAEHLFFVATNYQVMAYPANHCHGYKTCASCIDEGMGHCGWSKMEHKCTLVAQKNKLRTPYELLKESQFQCLGLPGSVYSQLDQSLSVDNLHSVKLLSGVDLPDNSRIICSADEHNFMVNGYISGSSIYCHFSASHIPQLMLQSELFMRFNVLIDVGNGSVTLRGGKVRFYNCSFLTRCSTCKSVEGCGWLYDGSCESASTAEYLTRKIIKQKIQQISYSSCPKLLASSNGQYVFSVGAPVNISLVTKDLLPSMSGYKYYCMLHSSNGAVLSVPATFNSSTQVLCHIKTYQISASSIHGGIEHLGISLWMKKSDEREYQIEHHLSSGAGRLRRSVPEHNLLPILSRYPRLTAVDCSRFSDSCSLCTAANKQAVNTCVWCVTSRTCTSLNQCSSSFINSSTRCYNDPIIRSVTPLSGPTVGGTVVTITGSDLGVEFDDINVKIGGVNCTVKFRSYLTAQQFSCVTGSSLSAGPVSINITVRRPTSFTAIFATGVSNEFVYARPIVTGVWPTYGPHSGGTILRLTGSALNISNTIETVVTAADIRCEINLPDLLDTLTYEFSLFSFRNISYHIILCELAASGTVMTGSVRLSIDHASVAAPQSFSFMENPQFVQLVPQFTIPSGGVMLRFYGNYLNVSVRPKLVVFVEHEPYSTTCIVASSQLLLCPAPKLESLLDHSASMSQLQMGLGESAVMLNYTVNVDGAPGPDINNQSLSLTLKDNPVLLEMADRTTYLVFSGNTISIPGRHLDSVSVDEIKVTLLDESCFIIMVTSTVIQCIPPDFPVRADRSIDIKVTIGDGTLVYSVGSIIYVRNNSTGITTLPSIAMTPSGGIFPSTIWVMVIVVSFVGVCIIILLIGLILTVCSIAARRRNRIFRVTHQDIPPNPRIDPCLEKSTNSVNWYEVVSDPLVDGDSRFNSERNLVHHVRQPSHSTTTSRIINMASDRESRTSQRLMTASPNCRSVPSLYNESRSCSVGRQSYTGLLHGDHIHLNPNEEYVRMSSHLVASNLSISTSAHDRHIQPEEEEEEDENDTSSNAEYVDMQTPEQGSKYSISTDSPPITFHKNLETIV